jgi:hypothetical protein
MKFEYLRIVFVTVDCRFSPYLVACYDSNNEEYQSVCRVMSGFSDAFYREVQDLWFGFQVHLSRKTGDNVHFLHDEETFYYSNNSNLKYLVLCTEQRILL